MDAKKLNTSTVEECQQYLLTYICEHLTNTYGSLACLINTPDLRILLEQILQQLVNEQLVQTYKVLVRSPDVDAICVDITMVPPLHRIDITI